MIKSKHGLDNCLDAEPFLSLYIIKFMSSLHGLHVMAHPVKLKGYFLSFKSFHEDPHTTFFCTPHDAGVVKDARF